uniref:Uncharacterized protein n=1 Tax=Panagrolaimus davidi TaxID=227884 RepID=A0A914QFK3_9BILA
MTSSSSGETSATTSTTTSSSCAVTTTQSSDKEPVTSSAPSTASTTWKRTEAPTHLTRLTPTTNETTAPTSSSVTATTSHSIYCRRTPSKIAEIVNDGDKASEIYFDDKTFIKENTLDAFRTLYSDYQPADELTVTSNNYRCGWIY